VPKTTYFANALINHTLRGPGSDVPGPAFARFSRPYVGLLHSDPTVLDIGTEVVGGSYLRQPIEFSDPSSGAVANVNTVTFPDVTSDWGAVNYFGVFDTQTGGKLLYYALLAVPRIFISQDRPIFQPGHLALVEF
jgi:hypothetical protein